jgi:hydrogenase-4 component B
LNFPLGGALLALTSALAAACFVRAFGIAFLALPRSPLAEGAHESPTVMLAPQGVLALVCLALGLVPGFVLQVLTRVLASLSGLPAPAESASRMWAMSSHGGFDHVMPAAIGLTLIGGLGVAALLAVRTGRAARRVPTWGCGGELSARSEYTATAFSKPLMMVFRAIYRPTREVDTLADVSQYFPREVRYRAEIEPTFERYLYGPLTRAVFRTANGMRVLQAGSLHAYLAYVLVLGVLLLIWLGGSL